MANPNTTRRSGPISTTGKVGYTLLVMFAVLAGLVVFTGMFGRVGGSELNPYTLDTREFTYYEIPIFHVQVMPTTRTTTSNTLQQWINTTKRLLKPSSDKRWDLVEGARTGAKTVPGVAMTLSEYLNAINSQGDLVWMEWSNEHSNLAGKLWPRVAWLAQQELYYLIPNLMDFAKSTDKTAWEFAEQADTLLQTELKIVSRKWRESGDSERAAKLDSAVADKVWRELEHDGSDGDSDNGDSRPQAEADA